MDQWHRLTDAIIRQHASADSYQRGREYYAQGAVSHIGRRGRQIQAEVEGSQYEPYRVQIAADAGGIVQALCTCPYDWGGWCKHIVATLLACVHDPVQIDERPTLPALLTELDPEQLQTLPVRLVERPPEVADIIEGVVHAYRPSPGGCSDRFSQRPRAHILPASQRAGRRALAGASPGASNAPASGALIFPAWCRRDLLA